MEYPSKRQRLSRAAARPEGSKPGSTSLENDGGTPTGAGEEEEGGAAGTDAKPANPPLNFRLLTPPPSTQEWSSERKRAVEGRHWRLHRREPAADPQSVVQSVSEVSQVVSVVAEVDINGSTAAVSTIAPHSSSTNDAAATLPAIPNLVSLSSLDFPTIATPLPLLTPAGVESTNSSSIATASSTASSSMVQLGQSSQIVLSSPPSTPLPSGSSMVLPPTSKPSSTPTGGPSIPSELQGPEPIGYPHVTGVGNFSTTSTSSESVTTTPGTLPVSVESATLNSTVSTVSLTSSTSSSSLILSGATISSSTPSILSSPSSTAFSLSSSSSSQTTSSSISTLTSSSSRTSTTSIFSSSVSSSISSSFYSSDSSSSLNTGANGFSGAATSSSRPSTSTGAAGSKNTSSSSPGPSAPVPTVVGGVVGGLAGLAILLVIALFLLRWRKQKMRSIQSISGGGSDSVEPQSSAGTGDPSGAMTQRSSQTPLAAAAALGSAGFMKRLRPHSQQTASTTETAPSQKRFENLGGRKLPSAFSPGAEGFGRSRETFSDQSFYRDSEGFYGGSGRPTSQTSTIATAMGSPGASHDGRRSEIAVLRPSPARTPVTSQGGIAFQNSPPAPPSPRRPNPPDGLGRSHPSHDESRGSRFTEEGV